MFVFCIFILPAASHSVEISRYDDSVNDLFTSNDIKTRRLAFPDIKRTGFYGDAAGRSKMFRRDRGEFYLKLVTSSRNGWGSAGIDFQEPIDVSGFDAVFVLARGRNGGEKIVVNLRDSYATDYKTVQSNSEPMPENGLSKDWAYIIFKLGDFYGDFDAQTITHLGFEIGSQTAGNAANCGVFIKDVVFCNKKDIDSAICRNFNENSAAPVDLSVFSSKDIIDSTIGLHLDNARKLFEDEDYDRSIAVAEELLKNFEDLSFKKGQSKSEISKKLAGCYWLKAQSLIAKGECAQAKILIKKLYKEYNNNEIALSTTKSAYLDDLLKAALPELKPADFDFEGDFNLKNISELYVALVWHYSENKSRYFASAGLLGLALFGGAVLKKREYRISRRDQEAWVYRYKKPHWKLKKQKEGIKLIYEINTRSYLAKRDKKGKIVYRKLSSIGLPELSEIKAHGFDTVWLMGIWQVSPKAKIISKNYGEDFEGSPYAIYDYRVNPELGGEKHFVKLVRNMHQAGLKVIVDFVPNHMGIDCPWINSNPEYFINIPLKQEDEHLSEWDLLHKYPGFFPTKSESYPEMGKRLSRDIMVAYGKDPNYFPWIDTAQLDYTSPGLRIRMVKILKDLARIVDGVRCDTVMLVLRDQIKNQWNRNIPWEYFDRLFPEEFWLEAIREVKAVNPNFIFIAETYWDKEFYLQSLDIDYTYNKNLYDILARVLNGHDSAQLYDYLKFCSFEFLNKSMYFLENHDEERAMNVFNVEAQKAASVIINALPGSALYYNGQLVGKKERLPVQRVIPLEENDFNFELMQFYGHGMDVFQKECFKNGKLYVLNPDNSNILCFLRYLQGEFVLVAVNLRGCAQKCAAYLPMDLLGMTLGKDYAFRDFYRKYSKKNGSDSEEIILSGEELAEQGLSLELEAYQSKLLSVVTA